MARCGALSAPCRHTCQAWRAATRAPGVAPGRSPGRRACAPALYGGIRGARRQQRCQRCRARDRERARGRTGMRLNTLRERMRCTRAAHHALRGHTDAAPEAAQAAGKLRRRKGRRAARCAQDQHRRHGCLPIHFRLECHIRGGNVRPLLKYCSYQNANLELRLLLFLGNKHVVDRTRESGSSGSSSCMATLEGVKVGVPRAGHAPRGERRAMYWCASQGALP